MKTVVVVGVGALGSALVWAGRNFGCHWNVVDFDRVEAKNLQSQVHTKQGVGRNKAVALQTLMLGLFGLKDIRAFPVKLTRDNLNLLDGADLVVDCTDNLEARLLLRDTCLDRKIPCVHGALAADGQFGRVVWAESFKPDGAAEGAVTCEDGEHLPFIQHVTAALASTVQRFLKDGKKLEAQLWPNGIRIL